MKQYRSGWASGLLIFVIALLALPSPSAIHAHSHSSIAQAPREQRAADKGDIKVVYATSRHPQYAELGRVLKDSQLFDEIAGVLNGSLALPRDLPVRFAECGVVNAFYDPITKSITMCYELVLAIAEDFSQLKLTDDELTQFTLHAVVFVFLHEIGHALIDMLRLPVTGREEDAADQLATLLLIESGAAGEEAALNSALWFLLEGKMSTIDDLPFWGEHSLSPQRFYNIACWVYGRNPVTHEELVTQGFLPEERAVRCGDEYRKLRASWTQLLGPYLKK